MESKQLTQVSCLIDNLTSDEDLRQELWVHYLSGNSSESFKDSLERIKLQHSINEEFNKVVYEAFNYRPSIKFVSFLDSFTEFEQNILYMLMLGLSLQQISLIKGIDEVRIEQCVASIRYNNIWNEYQKMRKVP